MHIHAISGYIENIYLVEDTAGLMLLDGCSRADVSTVLNFIRNTLAQPLTALKLIVVTHMHPDHAGGAHLLRAKTGARIACHPKAPRWYRGISGRIAHAIDVSLTWWVAGKLGKPKLPIWYRPILTPDLLLDDEHPLPAFEDWLVLYTPGHTDHDLSVLHGPSRQIYVADLIVAVKQRLTAPYPVCHPNQYKRSLKRVQSLDASHVLCAHVAPTKGCAIDYDALIQQAPEHPKNHWHSAKNRIRHILGKHNSQH